MNPALAPDKDIPLEALRGLAALSVLAFHLLMAFNPELPMDGAWWYGPVHGKAAVLLFFVLSGFVLTRRALATGDGRSIARGALKRWPRLAGPVLLSVLLSWALLSLGAMLHEEAGARSGSAWLANFTNDPAIGTVEPSLREAVLQGAVFSLLRGEAGDASYNSVLWTMRFELLGSFIAFALGLALVQLRGASLAVRLALVVVVALTVRFAEPYYLTFVLGVGLALVAVTRPLRIPGPVAAAMVLGGVYLLGYVDGSADHAWLSRLYGGVPPATYVHSAAAALLILAIEGSPGLRAALSGRWAETLGRHSFALYLVHLPLLCSAGAWTYLILGGGWEGALAASLVTVAATAALALPLARFDTWWARRLNRLAARVMPDPPRPAPAPVRSALAEGGMGAGWTPQSSERRTA